jgi:endonuclease/exonuclease/phosphatase family metal-dependent hydrolase
LELLPCLLRRARLFTGGSVKSSPKILGGRVRGWILSGCLAASLNLSAQTNVTVRVIAANLNGNTQSYQPFALRILQGLKPDIVCIQEFNYSNNADSDFRFMVDTAFGANFVYYREPFNSGGDIPNGIISRYPILNSGSWNDTVQSQPNRGFAWAQIDLPGTNDLYVVSVHLLTSSADNRGAEAANLKALIQSNFPSNAWIVVAGDFNTDSRAESPTMTTFDSYLSDSPIPDDGNGNSNTSGTRSKPHDYVLPSFSLTNLETATVFPSHSFPNGLVFDSTVYAPLSDVAPVQLGDSTNAQHMAVMRDFSIPTGGTNAPATNAPSITTQPQSQVVSPGSNVTFSVTASGTAQLAYQWLFNGTNISDATTNAYTLAGAQFTNAGNYSVIVTNLYGSVTSSNAVLTVTNLPPTITKQPQSQTVVIGQDATFTVTGTGTAPLSYQWLLSGTNISGANTHTCTRSNVQANDAGDYSVIITNVSGALTSSVATLTVLITNPVVFAQWNFNSVTPDGNTTTGTTSPSTGSGTATLIGGTSATFATGDTNLDPAGGTDNSGWNTASYPASTSNNKTAGVQFKVSTLGKTNVSITWSQRASNTGSKYARLQYSTNGINFADFPSAVSVSAGTVFEVKTNSLRGTAGVSDNTNFAFQIVSEFQSTATGSGSAAYVAANSGSTYAGGASGGTLRFDMVSVSGSPIITNSTPPTLSFAVFNGNQQFQFIVSGQAGATYIVQFATNLVTGVWLPLLTNTAPFTFTDTNPAASSQGFYRVFSSQ